VAAVSKEATDSPWDCHGAQRELTEHAYVGVGAKFDTRRRTGPLALSLFGTLIGTHSPWPVAGGCLIAAALLLAVAAVESLYGIDAEGRSLEEIADPLSSG
jgi:hypothetical protein